jgi:competence protein ComEA
VNGAPDDQEEIQQSSTPPGDDTRSYFLLIATLLGVVAITVIVTLWVSRDSSPPGVEILVPAPSSVTFQVSGEVERPGVYSLDGEPRIDDAIDVAGGFTADADKERVNLALRVRDGAKIVVPSSLGEVGTDREALPDIADSAPIGDVPIESSLETTGPLDLNTASKDQLMSLPGIGDVRADMIIGWRSANLINSVDDLLAISGIGSSTVEAIRDLVIQP